MAELPTDRFVMHGARDAMAEGLTHIEQTVNCIESQIIENPNLIFDFARSLIESTCHKLLEERSTSYTKENISLPKLVKKVGNSLSFFSSTVSDADKKICESLRETLNGLATTTRAICELRNQCGSASHGSGSPRPQMEYAQALFVARAADTIVGFLYRTHLQDRPGSSEPSEIFDNNPSFNESLDDEFSPFQIYDVEFRPSEVLFTLDREAYRNYLAEFDDGTDSEADASTDGTVQP